MVKIRKVKRRRIMIMIIMIMIMIMIIIYFTSGWTILFKAIYI